MLNKNEINEILGDKNEGWFPPIEDFIIETIEEQEARLKATDKYIEDLRKEGIYVSEMGKCRSNCCPTCSICDWDAQWGVLPERAYKCKSFSVNSSGIELADGEQCKIFHACRRHLNEVVKLCKEKENSYLKNVKKITE